MNKRKKKSAPSLESVRRRIIRQFREAARMIAESESHCGCDVTNVVDPEHKLRSVFRDLVFPGDDRIGCYGYWLGDDRIPVRGSAWAEVERLAPFSETWIEACVRARKQRVIGLLLCALFVRSLTKTQLRSVGYRIA